MNKNSQSIRRQIRIRKKIRLNSDRLRLSIFRSNRYLYAQIIDDKKGQTLFSLTEKSMTEDTSSRIERAKKLGARVAAMAKEKKITQVVFDKGRYAYHGRIKALAQGAREGGLKF